MHVNPFWQMLKETFNGTEFYYDEYTKHILLIGENGSIEIRSTEDATLDPAPSSKGKLHPYDDLLLMFEKAGADGRRLWEGATS